MKIILYIFLVLCALGLKAQATLPNSEEKDLMNSAEAYFEQKKYTISKNLFKKAAQQFKKSKNWEKYLLALNRVGDCYVHLSEWQKADKIAATVLNFDQALYPLLKARAYSIQAEIIRKKYDFKNALVPSIKALTIREKHLDAMDLELGTSYENTAHIIKYVIPDSSTYYFQKALDIFNAHPDMQLRSAQVILDKGFMEFENGRYQKASDHFDEGIAIHLNQHPVDSIGLAKAYYFSSIIFIIKESFTESINQIQKGLALLENQPLSKAGVNLHRLYFGLGIANRGKNDYPAALKALQKGFSVSRKVLGDDHPETTGYYNNMATMYAETHNFDEAISFFKKYLKSIQPIGNHQEISKAISNIGHLYFDQGNYSEALTYFNHALAKYQQSGIKSHPDLATLFNNLAKTNFQVLELESALLQIDKALYANCLEILSHSYDVSMTENCFDVNVLLASRHLKARTLFRLSQKNNSLSYLEKAYQQYQICDSLIEKIYHSHIEEEDQLNFGGEAYEVFKDAIQTCFELNRKTQNEKYLEQAFYFSERSKSNILVKGLAGMKALRFANLPDSVLATIHLLQSDISSTQKQLQKARQNQDSTEIHSSYTKLADIKNEYQQTLLLLEENYPEYYRLKYDHQRATITQIQSALKDSSTALLEYAFADSSVFIFSITETDFYVDKIPLAGNWRNELLEFRKTLTDIDFVTQSATDAFFSFATHSYGLYQQFIKPIERRLHGVGKIKIIPDGILGYIPFEVLLTTLPDDLQKINYTLLAPNYLIQDFVISYAYSATMMLEDQKYPHTVARYNYGGFAPEYDLQTGKLLDSLENLYAMRSPTSQVDLPAARKAVAYIAEMVKGTAFLSAYASENIFKEKAKQYNILHLAMHGVLNDKDPLYSKLIFSPSNDTLEDNYLNAYELYNMQLPAQLAVLSACNTGMGTLQKGEGVMSLSRAFAYAGVRSIIMSLWSVPDEETGQLMTTFFDGIKKGESKDAALRNAKLAYLNNDNVLPERLHPLFWSGFIQIGDSSHIKFQQSAYPWFWMVGGLLLLLGILGFRKFYK